MLTLRLTNKVLKKLPLSKSPILNLPEHGDAFEDWYVNLFFFEKRKHLIFTHAGSLVSFVTAGVYKKDMEDLEKIFRQGFMRFLVFHKFDEEDIGMLQLALNVTRFAKTIDRRVMGSMLDMVQCYQSHIIDAYRHNEITPEEYALYRMNQNLLSVINYQYPIEVFRIMVTALKGFHHIPGQGAVGLN